MNLQNAISLMNKYGSEKKAFFFMIDFLGKNAEVIALDEDTDLLFNINGISNAKLIETNQLNNSPRLEIKPIAFDAYKKAFDLVQAALHQGNSFLVNLTFATPISLNISLEDIFYASKAKYRLLSPGKFVCFSPETFVKIEAGKISSNPMKGTISADIPNAKEQILKNPKELAEHTTIVDLIRNDLSMVANKVQVERFRYVEKITTNRGDILQVSSKITGHLPEDYPAHIGSMIAKLLPAGSISGAPKPKTVEIIKQAENYERGFYTGICGVFDGINLDSGVMIRFIENMPNGLVFKSGGGITALSNVKEEYEELMAKVYLPL